MENKEIIDYIGKHYKFFQSMALKITRDTNSADDLISTIILQYADRSKIETTNINGFIYSSMRNNFNSITSPYARTYQGSIDFNDDINTSKEEYTINDREDLFNEIIDEVMSETSLSKYEKQIWLYYYYPESVYRLKDIKGLSMKEMNKLRNNSYRNIQKKTLINYVTICNVVNDVNEKCQYIFDKFRKNNE